MVVEDGCKRLFSGLICEILYAVGQGKFYIYHRKVSKFKKNLWPWQPCLKCSFWSSLSWLCFFHVLKIVRYFIQYLHIEKLPGRTYIPNYSFYVFFLDAPTATIQQCSTPVTEGNNATLYCNATGNPAPNITWIRKSTRQVVSANKVLVIEAIKSNGSGSYECLAWNGIGNNSTNSCTVDVYCK